MTIGVGGSTADKELAAMKSMRGDAPAIDTAERQRRIGRAQSLMQARGIGGIWLDVSTSLTYFTGLRLGRSERLHGAILPAKGELTYLSPAFEVEKLKTMIALPGAIAAWDEHEDPTALVIETLRRGGTTGGTIGIDEATPFASFEGFRRNGLGFEFVNAAAVTAACRSAKTDREIALMQTAKNITLEVHKAAARMLRPGITTTEVQGFIAEAHARLGADGPPGFNIVLFGEATAYPHGVPYPQTLKDGDMVLIDIGAPVDGYLSDITRSYVFGTPNKRQRQVWELEKKAQLAAFDAAQLGRPCQEIDRAARRVIEAAGFGPGYATPGLPHRTGHGIGLDVHETPYIVEGDSTLLAPGMTFSIEPMICIYGEFGVRLEDHIHMTATGPRWFTPPAHSIDDPFGRTA